MSEEESKALISRPAYGLQQPGSGAVLSRIVSDALVIARAREITSAQKLIRVGNYEFREEDYRQIVIWGREIGKTPEELVSLFEQQTVFEQQYHVGRFFIVEDGVIKSIRFPRELDKLRQTRALAFSRLSGLEKLICGITLTELDLSNLPALTSLFCGGNQLTELDLSHVPTLTDLVCCHNPLSELDLSLVPGLTSLDCEHNQLSELDLSPVPGLTSLHCGGNQLTELDLSPVPTLTDLNCSNNQLTELDLSPVPGLFDLVCSNNQLTELDLSPVPGLTFLYCEHNQLSELDFRGNPQLKLLNCDPSVRIIKHEWQSFNIKHESFYDSK